MYNCNVCGKEFDKERSMAGHLSSHNRLSDSYKLGRKKEVIQVIQDPKQCCYCEKIFSTGWQLGGHKTMCDHNPNKLINILKRTKRSINYDLLPQEHYTTLIT